MTNTSKTMAGRPGKSEIRASEMARREADRQARRIPWERLLGARQQYVEWNTFILWVRAITGAEGRVHGWLVQAVEERCPGLIGSERLNLKAGPGVGARLDRGIREWVEENVLADSKQAGWLRAVTFYAVRDLAYARDSAYAQWCEKHWKQQPPASYPSFEGWRIASERCDDEVLDACELREDRRQVIKAARLVGSERLEAAVAEYMEWEAFTYWLRSLLETDTQFPETVTQEVQTRCPGFFESDKELRNRLPVENYTQRWKALLEWGEKRSFREPLQERWFDVLQFYARAHPRSVRTVDYWVFYWDEHWSSYPQVQYPPFEVWRRAADSYVVPASDV